MRAPLHNTTQFTLKVLTWSRNFEKNISNGQLVKWNEKKLPITMEKKSSVINHQNLWYLDKFNSTLLKSWKWLIYWFVTTIENCTILFLETTSTDWTSIFFRTTRPGWSLSNNMLSLSPMIGQSLWNLSYRLLAELFCYS